jgi:hypothetical protein
VRSRSARLERTSYAKGHRGKTSGRSIFQSAPVARHFVCPSRSISRAISKRLATRCCTLFGRVGFSPWGKLLRFLTEAKLHWLPDFHSCHCLEVIETAKHSVQKSCRELQPDSLKRFPFRYNRNTFFCHFAPLAQLDRASGYEPEGREFESLRAHHFSVFLLNRLKRRQSPALRSRFHPYGLSYRGP